MTTPIAQRDLLRNALEQMRYELVPVASMFDEVSSLPEGSTVTLTSSSKIGIDHAVRSACELARMGFTVVPHLAARLIRDQQHLATIVERLSSAGVDDVMVLAGDANSPAGPCSSALDLLNALESMGSPFSQIGISGYPEGHPSIGEVELKELLQVKARHATYIVTQLCFSASAVDEWLSGTRSDGVDLPVLVGIPGRVSQKRLLAMAARIGVGESIRFLKRNSGSMVRMLLTTEFDPEPLVRSFQPLLEKPSGVSGFHVYTFNSITATEVWRQDLIQRL
jgi:methylenetetrahydrofolate reductase (NADPH)